ncbi:uncharacterized protein LOC129892800 [Solanum dulcamara]|uniref:uncharacterized protein LOC129892800 n=1 Tax=Solanum dulcamara TaxID=45834 RepID=UPI002485D3B3|nr:uncharacterized protein LOC129892800 [Solanum dulcamara]
MDGFLVVGDTFEACLEHLGRVLQKYVETNPVFNWKKFHFMVKEGIVLANKILGDSIQVDQAKVQVIAKLPTLISVKCVQNFLGHIVSTGFIKYFSKAYPLSKLLEKENIFHFDEAYLKAFLCLKEKLISSPIIIAPD